jgi:iron complex outermembrane receptor protein
LIKTYAPQVGYFTAPQQVSILGATTIGAMQTALNFDATSGELAYRKLERSNFNMKVGQSSLQSSVLFKWSLSITENLEVYAFGVLVIEKVKQDRRPNQSRACLYPNGFLPEIHSTMTFQQQQDLEENIENWNFDLSNGKTDSITIFKISNATLRENLTEFDAGGLDFLKTQF